MLIDGHPSKIENARKVVIMMQIATHPMLTSAPTVHPLINAAHMALGKLRQKK